MCERGFWMCEGRIGWCQLSRKQAMCFFKHSDTEGERRPLTCSMLGKHVQRQLEVEEQQTRTGAGGGGASYQLKFPTYFSHQLLTNFPLFSQRLCPAGMGGSSFTLPLGATFLESGFTSATPRPSSSEPNNVEWVCLKSVANNVLCTMSLFPSPPPPFLGMQSVVCSTDTSIRYWNPPWTVLFTWDDVGSQFSPGMGFDPNLQARADIEFILQGGCKAACS